ncbi:hypothetical protein JTE90_021038 [Oedothorax gibbosus]|uniref:TIL domain-containing protein n=1 Tax=Oedothorax gibbosus TaxID=931172 RepID=A0AAV6VTC5_9ARAC|nr:hypothetical protein JTE90_021038 [Oedothorax gibbosus]
MFLSAVLSVSFYISLVVSQKCPENAIYSECSCLLTCESPYPSDECTESCQSGCFCKPGYLLRNGDMCVPHAECDATEDNNPKPSDGNYRKPQEGQYPRTQDRKPPNTQYGDYPKTQYGNPPKPQYNNPPNTPYGNPHNSPYGNPPNTPYGNPPNTPYGNPPSQQYPIRPEDGGNYPKTQDGKSRRPSQCPENSVFIACGSACAPTCDDPRLRSCGDKCHTACYCKPGFLTSRDGKGCVRPEHCDLKQIPEPVIPKCPANSIFIRCGSACVPTCQNPYPGPCNSDECVTACFCKPGYLMNVNSTACVRPDQCEKTKPAPTTGNTATENVYNCTETAVFDECGSMCPPTCEQPNPGQCSLECASGCFCKPGFFKRKDGKCVKPQECQMTDKCGADQQYYECTPSCKNNCKNYNNPGVRCACGPPGCFCREGLVKRGDGKCVQPSQCPKKCGPDEQYYECTPSCKNTCGNYNNPGVKCDCGPPGCFCREGLVKRADGKCVRKNQCPLTPPKCVANAAFTPCGSSCPPTCENPKPLLCSQKCEAGCFCKPGYLLTKDGACVLHDQCRAKNQTIQCGENEEFKECGSACPETCATSQQPPKFCTLQCVAGCFCKPSFVKNTGGKCVPKNLCEKSPESGVTFGDSRGCPDQKLCEAFCKSHKLNVGFCVGKNKTECHCA